MTKRICFIGNAGSGKTTLAGDVFTTLKKQHKNAEHIPEWIRFDIQKNGPMRSIWEQYRTRSKQKEWEDAAPETIEYLITDSGILTPYFYACLYADKTDDRSRLVLNDMHEYLLEDIYNRRYDYVFFLPMAETYASNPQILKDGTRYQTEEEILALEAHFDLVFTKHHKLDNIHVLDCPLDDRVQAVLKIIN
jgi:nicotinamide riboside kinase